MATKNKIYNPKESDRFSFPPDFEKSETFQYLIASKKTFEWEVYEKIRDITEKEPLILVIYIPHLVVMFHKNSQVLNVLGKDLTCEVNMNPFYDIYKKGYKNGLNHFKKNYSVSADIIYNPASLYERDLHTLYFHPPKGDISGEWISYKNYYPFVFKLEQFELYGFYAALLYSVFELQRAYPQIFRNFSECKMVQDHNNEKPEYKADSEISEIFEFLKPLNGKWNNSRIMSEQDFQLLIQNVKKLIKDNKKPSNLKAITLTSTIPQQFIRHSFYLLHQKFIGRKVNLDWIDFIYESFHVFKNTSKTTFKREFSQYRHGSYENDIKRIKYDPESVKSVKSGQSQ